MSFLIREATEIDEPLVLPLLCAFHALHAEARPDVFRRAPDDALLEDLRGLRRDGAVALLARDPKGGAGLGYLL